MLKKINIEHLRVGMHVHELCGSWMEHPFWRTKFVIKDADEIRLIVDSAIKEVWIDVAKGIDVSAPAKTSEEVAAGVDAALMNAAVATGTPLQVVPPKRTAMSEELKRAARICTSAKSAVVAMFNEVRMGKAISGEAAGELVDEISSSVMRNPGALISLARLKTADDYTYMHSVAVCALMVALAGRLGFDETQTRDAGMSGLLHDLGKALLPMGVLNKPGKLTDEEFRIIKGHPEEGHRLLLEGGTVDGVPLDVVLHHHEKIDGSGYPHRLKGEQISVFARMGAVCDVYDAITSNRPYKAGWDPAESIRKMTEWCNGHFDARIFQAFVKSIGIYPVGSLVRMSSGRLGVVAEQSERSLLTPRIRVFFSSKSMTHVPPELIDLARPGITEKIVAREDPQTWGFKNLEQFWVA